MCFLCMPMSTMEMILKFIAYAHTNWWKKNLFFVVIAWHYRCSVSEYLCINATIFHISHNAKMHFMYLELTVSDNEMQFYYPFLCNFRFINFLFGLCFFFLYTARLIQYICLLKCINVKIERQHVISNFLRATVFDSYWEMEFGKISDRHTEKKELQKAIKMLEMILCLMKHTHTYLDVFMFLHK